MQGKAEKARNVNYNEIADLQNTAITYAMLNKNGIDISMPFSREIFLMSTRINGAMFVKNIRGLAKKLSEGEKLQMLLETENPYDSKAILVLNSKGKKLGYIPRVKNEVLFHLMDAGKELFAIVVGGTIGDSLNPEKNYIEINIDVYMID